MLQLPPTAPRAALLAFGVLLQAASAHDVITTKLTWTREVSRIVRKRCSACHKPAGAAMSLLTFEQARPWAVAIREEVLARRMPPWPAVAGYGNFKNELRLTEQEISILANWVEGGAPEGEPEFLPTHSLIGRLPVSKPPAGPVLQVHDGSRLQRPVTLRMIQLRGGPENLQVKLRAILPSGSVEPLLWLLPNPNVRRAQPFLLEDTVELPAGTMFETEPPSGSAFQLTVAPSRGR